MDEVVSGNRLLLEGDHEKEQSARSARPRSARASAFPPRPHARVRVPSLHARPLSRTRMRVRVPSPARARLRSRARTRSARTSSSAFPRVSAVTAVIHVSRQVMEWLVHGSWGEELFYQSFFIYGCGGEFGTEPKHNLAWCEGAGAAAGSLAAA